MQTTEILKQMGGVSSLAQQLGLTEDQAQQGAEALLPALLGGFQKQMQAQPQASGGISGLLGSLGGSDFLSQALGHLAGSDGRASGQDILGQVFGSKEVSRTVADNAAQKTGLSAHQLKQMLPLLAAMVASFISKQSASAETAEGGLGGLLGGLLGGQSPTAAGAQKSGLSGLISMLDVNGDGNPLDDILRMMKK
ncbi:DUF937 domain-containing protein [Denitrificimonas sp. JX-1]|uniref:DUF937 domain-containing protein n=1 Tax=Denitrificimonas halotolerans TaxID=3098930 RepID=A0ABU5GRL6_9GAMM|nr:DUF937 domain-containing protein [Denitrificimonas sp. JX-1]MDY7219635.1 DUF937 domain-containing protein [Denitrificimonas sp. JX-1]